MEKDQELPFDIDTGYVQRGRVLVQHAQGGMLFFSLGSPPERLRKVVTPLERAVDAFIARCQAEAEGEALAKDSDEDTGNDME